MLRFLQAIILLLSAALASAAPPPPGTIVHHSAAKDGLYIGSPSLCVLPDGSYLASHDLFGPASGEHQLARGRLYRSTDKGATWQHITDFEGFFWQSLFVHRGAAYALGMDKHHGRVVIRRSPDGLNWSAPVVLAEGEWHTAPMPVVEYQGRIWRAVEDAMGGTKWGERYRARMMSAPADADLLDPKSWSFTNPLPRDPAWLGGDFAAWLEGNAVIDPEGKVVDILRVDNSQLPEKAAIVRINQNGTEASFDPAKDFIDFPGGAKKFTIRRDAAGGYWSLASIVETALPGRPASIRNTLALVHSRDLRSWDTRCILLRHPDVAKHGFQYVDWQFDGEDLIALCRTAWEDDEGGAHNNHDANFLTFHRWQNFRQLTRKDDIAMADLSATSYRRFSVADADTKVSALVPIPEAQPPRWAREVSQGPAPEWKKDHRVPYFEGPIPFVRPPEDAGEPFYPHNHQPSVTSLPNGDLFAIWYSTRDEKGPELTVLASRLRAGAAEWDPSSEFFKAEGRNMHGSSIFHDGHGTLYHFNGMAPAGAKGWDNLALLLRTSFDNGVTWTAPRAIDPAYQGRNQVISGTRLTHDGTLIQACDAVPGSEGGTALHLSRDRGANWRDPGANQTPPGFRPDEPGHGIIAGIHAGVVELNDGRLLAMGRGNNIDGHMPMSTSEDGGKTWAYSASPFTPIAGGQRLVLMRLKEGPLLLASFTNTDRRFPRSRGMDFPKANGGSFTGYGLYVAISEDEGKTWPVRKLVTPGSGDFDGGAWTKNFTAAPDNAEHAGYLASTQSEDGTIHLLSSRLHYRFNLAWIREPAH
ncbi:sialidase family protein [Haloferula sp. BvORR071]|uniref:sialidase family protein n=1 Tax=Haloferula sp. BvORR071 TaxID=1396141 RepID=UPI0009462365|nr:sialidase family protein [Haloferula sp. BvORR071]